MARAKHVLRRPGVTALIGATTLVVAMTLIVRTVDAGHLVAAAGALVQRPLAVLATLTAYAGAFALRALAWRRVLPRLGLGHALAAMHVSLGANHVLPLRLGEPLRVTSVVRRAGISLSTATASTVTLRAADVAAVTLLALVAGGPLALRFTDVGLPVVAGLFLLAGAGGVAGAMWLRRLRARQEEVVLPGPLVLALTGLSWVVEAVVVWQVAAWAGAPIGFVTAVAVTSVTIIAQVAAIAPGGVGTYEAAATAALVAAGLDAPVALAVAVAAHALKTVYALVTGAVALFVPGPATFGRLRLPPRPARDGVVSGEADERPARGAGGVGSESPGAAASGRRPVVLFLPAHNEAATVSDVVARAPREVRGHPVQVVVVDDGSTDATADLARAVGAEVVELDTNRGLGAAVRVGLADAVARGVAAVAFCDADGEYAPEELGDVVAPVLDGTADYVVGSRFTGDIRRMLPHRRLGNLVLTAVVRFVVRRPVTDGQSGYRALSRDAAAAADIPHDFNYAQVLTIDLLAKGFRYGEVPISYRFREHGRSFVRLGEYLRAVLPTVWRQLNPAPNPVSD